MSSSTDMTFNLITSGIHKLAISFEDDQLIIQGAIGKKTLSIPNIIKAGLVEKTHAPKIQNANEILPPGFASLIRQQRQLQMLGISYFQNNKKKSLFLQIPQNSTEFIQALQKRIGRSQWIDEELPYNQLRAAFGLSKIPWWVMAPGCILIYIISAFILFGWFAFREFVFEGAQEKTSAFEYLMSFF